MGWRVTQPQMHTSSPHIYWASAMLAHLTSAASRIRLNDGNMIPVVGFGVWDHVRALNVATLPAIKDALSPPCAALRRRLQEYRALMA